MSFTDRYRSAGLVRNPFCTQAIADSEVFISRGVREPPERYSQTLVQVVAPRGYGKSTHLATWRARQDAPYHYIPLRPYGERWARAPHAPDGLVYGDEIDRMPAAVRWGWFKRLARGRATLVIGTHTDLSRLGRLAGFAEVRTHTLAPLDLAGVKTLIEARLADSQIDASGSRISFSPVEIARIHQATGGVPRAVEAACHSLVSEKVSLRTSATS